MVDYMHMDPVECQYCDSPAIDDYYGTCERHTSPRHRKYSEHGHPAISCYSAGCDR